MKKFINKIETNQVIQNRIKYGFIIGISMLMIAMILMNGIKDF